MRKNLLSIIAFTLIAIFISIGLNVLLKPKMNPETAIENYHRVYNELWQLDDNSLDVLYLGSSHSFCSISPEDIYKKFGITGFVQGTSCQKLWQSYYYLEEALYTQHPKVVVLDTFMALDGSPQSEPFNREAIDQMKLTPAKVKAALTAYKMNPDAEDLISYFIPAFRYHDRWSKLSQQDFDYFITPEIYLTKGCFPRTGTGPCEFNIDAYNDPNAAPVELNETCNEYLCKIKAMCDENNIEFILVKYPTCLWNKTNSLTIRKWAEENNVKFLDFNADPVLREQVAIDWSIDSLDGGNHLNYNGGAMKMSDWMGNYLTSNFEFKDKRQDPAYSEWDKDYDCLKKCINNLGVHSISNIDEYITVLRENDYIAAITIDNIIIVSYPNMYNKLAELGISDDILTNSFRRANLSVVSTFEQSLIYGAYDTSEVSYVRNIYNENKNINKTLRIKSTFSDENQLFSCVYDKKEYANGMDGLQFVVFDSITGNYVDTSLWLVTSEGNFVRAA